MFLNRLISPWKIVRDIIKEALAKPMGSPPLIDIVHPGDRIAW
jgi:hypothetical protein